METQERLNFARTRRLRSRAKYPPTSTVPPPPRPHPPLVWRDDTGQQRSRTFSLKRDADAWEAKIKLAKRQGELAALDAGRQTLAEFSADWWRLYADPHLATATRRGYAASGINT